MHAVTTVITFSENQTIEPCIIAKKDDHETESATRLNIILLVKIYLATLLLYSGLVYFYQIPKLHQLIRASGPFAVNECQFLQSPTSTPISSTMVQIDWVTSCRSDSAVISYKPAANRSPSSPLMPGPSNKISLGILVQSGASSNWFHYRATLYVKKDTEIIYKLYTGIDILDRLSAAQYRYEA
ncbi:hypothetical protein J3B02_002112 [Coemansia erecta]|nr:hypothetical protein J3B02_002112 [Coemansia erecta]KAJ2877348.1 hypothetical protein FB639_003805 [Coemansia asiatica]